MLSKNFSEIEKDCQRQKAKLAKIQKSIEEETYKKQQLKASIKNDLRRRRSHRLIILGGIVAKYLQHDMTYETEEEFLTDAKRFGEWLDVNKDDFKHAMK